MPQPGQHLSFCLKVERLIAFLLHSLNCSTHSLCVIHLVSAVAFVFPLLSPPFFSFLSPLLLPLSPLILPFAPPPNASFLPVPLHSSFSPLPSISPFPCLLSSLVSGRARTAKKQCILPWPRAMCWLLTFSCASAYHLMHCWAHTRRCRSQLSSTVAKWPRCSSRTAPTQPTPTAAATLRSTLPTRPTACGAPTSSPLTRRACST